MHMTKKTRNTMKPPAQTQSSPAFEGVYNNARMLHFLTAVVGSTCDVRVKNGTVYEGIFKTLSSQCELAVDAVHKRSEGLTDDGDGGGEEGGGGGGRLLTPMIEEITDTMIFSPADLVTMTCRDVDLNYAIRDTFTDSAISSTRVNGEHREKVLQRWDGGGSNGENYDLESDASNGWDANEMFKFNAETYGIKSTYDSSLSMYTVPLERGNSEVYRQREARAARLANEIESSLQYRRRVSLENDEGKNEEEKFSSVVRDREDRASPGFTSGNREGKYIPLPQRAREMGMSASSLRGGAASRTGVPGSSKHAPPGSSSSSSSSPKPSSDRSSPLSGRTVYSPHQTQGSPPSACSPPCSNHEATSRSSVNGVVPRTSPKSQRPPNSRTLRTPNSQSSPAVSRSPKPDATPQDIPLGGRAYQDSSSSAATETTKPSGPTPLFTVDVNEILNSAKERTESLISPQEGKSSKAPSVQQRSQLDELRRFGKEFRLQPSSPPAANTVSLEPPQPNTVQTADSASPAQPKSGPSHTTSAQGLQQTTEGTTSSATPAAATTPTTQAIPQSTASDGPSPGIPPPARTPGSEEPQPDSSEQAEGVSVAAVQVKNSTLNPNAKEFLPVKGSATVHKSASTPTPPRPTPPSPSVVLPTPPGQHGGGAIYSNPPGPYLSYVSPITIQGHSVQAPQMYQYTMSTISQGKYPRAKGPVVGPRPEHHTSPASPMIQAAASAAGPPLVASPYPQSYLQYGQVIQAMPPHYHGQNNLLDPNQSGLKVGHSTETAFLAVTESLHSARANSLCPDTPGPVSCIRHSEPPDPPLYPRRAECHRFCTLNVCILPDGSLLPDDMEGICVGASQTDYRRSTSQCTPCCRGGRGCWPPALPRRLWVPPAPSIPVRLRVSQGHNRPCMLRGRSLTIRALYILLSPPALPQAVSLHRSTQLPVLDMRSRAKGVLSHSPYTTPGLCQRLPLPTCPPATAPPRPPIPCRATAWRHTSRCHMASLR
ncbi:ataxin-2-like protein isoform X2 [Lampris incognitus]|uniref:ataxin-2-like protein isoform X2 n=1 Tax=Lampris incognitus TaxID=2546036 RepID=UPI0024B4E9CD|nr:ataxin-2-like protein isoform X2 [Lampris incognitus]